MATITKHVGKYGEKPCVVVYREVPNEPENCLIVQTSSLPEREHDDLMNIVQSAEGQESHEISNVFHRRQFTSGENVLSYLHYGKHLRKVPVSHVSLTPIPNQSIPLAEVNAEIRKLDSHQGLKTDPKMLNETAQSPKTNTVAPADSEASEASNLLFQAQLMKEDADRLAAEAEEKMNRAYELDPSLKPKKKGRPKKADSV